MARDKNEAINSYITDMLALEDHIEKAVRGQLEDLKDYPDVVSELRQVHRRVEHHISDLKQLSERRSAGGAADAIKRAGSTVLGFVQQRLTWCGKKDCRRICATTTQPSAWRLLGM